MVYSHCPGPGLETGQGPWTASMVSNMLCRNVHIGLRQRQVPGHIVSYCGSPVSCTGCDPIPKSRIASQSNIASKWFIRKSNLQFA